NGTPGGMLLNSGGPMVLKTDTGRTFVVPESQATTVKRPPRYRSSGRYRVHLVRCPKCSMLVGTGYLLKHRNRCWASQPQVRQQRPSGVASAPTGSKKIAPLTTTVAAKREDSKAAPQHRALVRCPSCIAQVRSDRLNRHLLRIHQQRPGVRRDTWT